MKCLFFITLVLLITTRGVAQVGELGEVDHAGIIRGWDPGAFDRGKRIYDGICITCHGNMQVKGTLPTSRPFWKDPFKQGSDPYRLYLTLKNGLDQMPPQPYLTPKLAYDVIHYIREELIRDNNPSQYFDITEDYLTSLPKATGTEVKLTKEMLEFARGPQYLRMNFGPSLNWTYQVEPGNIAYKGIAIRLDEGVGGISKGRAWMLYDHDTLRVAAAWTGEGFVDWRGIAFDGSHGTHTAIVGERAFVNPVGPGWANPLTGSWVDPRLRGRDNKPYGPLERDWAHYKGHYLQGNRVVLHYTIGDANILESPALQQAGKTPVFSRMLNVGRSSKNLAMRVAPADIQTMALHDGQASLAIEDAYHVLRIPASSAPIKIRILMAKGDPGVLAIPALVADNNEDLTPLTQGGPERWDATVVTRGKRSTANDAFVVDEVTAPFDNPWQSWMRLGGFDFFKDSTRAAVCTWMGDVWIVDGIGEALEQLHWQRIATGLFQPLGLKIVKEVIYVSCRDQIAELHDLNGDGEIDWYRNFNNDHQVTEHFHEFAMGLQSDAEGNFYYAKSARHAMTALVPHHGTLLKVSSTGSATEILATGFRAANGVCVNGDGSFFVTDQEGHWTPKNRINWVLPGGFYGNMMGYHDVRDASDNAMEQPLCWITNGLDRSPGELVWARNASWGPLNGALLEISYGTGHLFIVPHEKVSGQLQGGMVRLQIPDFPTGVMRGRFHPADGQLYCCGLFGWAGNKSQSGGFYRVRYTERPLYLPIELQATERGLRLAFTDALDAGSAGNSDNYKVKVWSLRRTKNYGSKHHDERSLKVAQAEVAKDGKSVFLELPGIAPTWCMEIRMDVKGADGTPARHTIHNTIHHLQGVQNTSAAVSAGGKNTLVKP